MYKISSSHPESTHFQALSLTWMQSCTHTHRNKHMHTQPKTHMHTHMHADIWSFSQLWPRMATGPVGIDSQIMKKFAFNELWLTLQLAAVSAKIKLQKKCPQCHSLRKTSSFTISSFPTMVILSKILLWQLYSHYCYHFC